MALEKELSHSPDCGQTIEEIEWNKLKKFRFKEGFVDGKCLGEETTLKNGFNHGYQKGFEISYPIFVIKGLLAVNKLFLKEKKTFLITLADNIDESLDAFEKKCSEYKLNCITFENDRVHSNDSHSEESNYLLSEMVCFDGDPISNTHKISLNKINLEFLALKEKVLHFLEECEQPLLSDQISKAFEKWEHQQLTKSDVSASKCVGDSIREKVP